MSAAANKTVINKTYRDQRSALEKFVDDQLKEKVLRGLELLRDEYGDEWADHITPESLDLSSEAYCVLGQLYGSYSRGVTELGIPDREDFYSGADFGFKTSPRIPYSDLQSAWIDVLTRDPYETFETN